MLAKVESACLVGIEGARVHVEVSLAKGLPCFSIVGLPDASIREAKDRVVAAIRNTGFEFPARRVTVNLAPAELKKEGSFFDLAIAVGILLASEAITPPRWPRCLWLGELALDGAIRCVRGALPLVRSLSQKGWCDFVLPTANVAEVSVLTAPRLYPFSSLGEVVQWLQSDRELEPTPVRRDWRPASTPSEMDLSEIKGQTIAKRALEIAAAGHHNVLLVGCPGTGKSLLAQTLPSLLPLWSLEEALEATQVHSVAGALNGSGLLRSRPFRRPHHTASPVALIGGGDVPMPGEISLAHRGVLFLDELPEFRRDALEGLRQPMEEGVVHIHRARGRATFPSQFLLISAMNPCPCGYRGHPKRECSCPLPKIHKYLAKISGPLLDRMDLHVEMPVLKLDELFSDERTSDTSAVVQKRVERARQKQIQRFPERPQGQTYNAHLKGKEFKKYCSLHPEAQELLKAAVERLGLSARAFDRIRKVARTIADLDNEETLQARHIAEAIQYRFLDRERHF